MTNSLSMIQFSLCCMRCDARYHYTGTKNTEYKTSDSDQKVVEDDFMYCINLKILFIKFYFISFTKIFLTGWCKTKI